MQSRPSKRMRIHHQLVVPPELDGTRLDRAVATLAGSTSRSEAKSAILAGKVEVAGTVVTSPRRPVSAGEAIAALIEPPPDLSQTRPVAGALDVVASDARFLVVNKPAGLVVHPARGHLSDTLANAVAAHCPAAAALPRAGIVHRLDKDTSGLIVIARTNAARLALQRGFKERLVGRAYLAIVHGNPPATGRIEREIGRSRANRLKMAVAVAGRPATTRFRVLARSAGFALARCELASGRTHQIRVHMEHAGFPVAGDRLYRKHARAEGGSFPRQMLHAYTLQFTLPDSAKPHSFVQPPPPDFAAAARAAGLVAAELS